MQPECTCVCAHIYTHTQSRVPEIAAKWPLPRRLEFLARARRIDDSGQVMLLNLPVSKGQPSAVRRLGTVTVGKLDCVWRPRGLFCTLQLVWQAPPPPGSATNWETPSSQAVRKLCQGTVSPTFVLHTKPTAMATFLAGECPGPCVLMRKL